MSQYWWVYLDESGDLGFNWGDCPKTSPYFVVTLLVCQNAAVNKQFNTAVKRTLRNKLNSKANKKRLTHELKGVATAFSIKRYFFRQLPESEWEIYTVILNKSRVNANLQTRAGKKKFYNFLANFVIEKIEFPPDLAVLILVLDRCKNNEEIEDFNEYLGNQLAAKLPSLDARIDINHEKSHNNPGLQAVDMFCWGIARKVTYQDNEWYNLFEKRIKFETVYLKDNSIKK